MNITEPIRRAARLTPDAVAIIRADNTALTYRALEHAIDRMATYAAGLGLRPGDIAGLAITPPDETPALVLALALARMGIASAEPSVPAARLRLRFQALRAGQPIEPGCVAFDASWMTPRAGAPEHVVPIQPGGAALCRVFASSGTTGRPKHVPVSHDVMVRRVFARWLGLSGGHAVRMIAIGLGGAWGFLSVLRTLWEGGTIVLFDPGDPIAAIRRHGVTSIAASTVALRSMLDALPPDAAPLPALEAIEVGGSMVPVPLRQRAAARLCANVVVYLGSTEMGGVASAPVAALDDRPGAVGYMFSGIRIEAVEASGQALPPGTEGILRMQADTMAERYLEEDAATSGGLRDSWFYPGDVGTVWPDGMLSLTGRVAELINAGGEKVSPAAIEEHLLKLPSVTDAAAFGVPDNSGVEQIWAAIVASVPVEDAVLDAFCKKLGPRQAPMMILQVEALPRNANGKIQRNVLIEAALQMNRTA
ncbi:MAG TPA: class I adenylate-forming enzyme family protein [Acetobacteraceae bacterium]|jgi:acyl-coenzyme A synthetase/AMP-(fatty) acid ligase